jgi:hypothetical protein
MPAMTFLSDWEVRAWASVPDDKDCNELLQSLRKATGENWLIGVTTRQKFRKAWHRMWFVENGDHKFYTLYADCHGEWQVINLVTPNGGSVFHGSAQSREDVMNFILGYLGGIHHASRDAKAA